MDRSELQRTVEELKEKLNKSQRQVAGLRQKSKYLEMQYDDSRSRETNTNELIMELLERQRELNVMLNRANIMLNRTQEAMALSSMELNEMAKALPEPKKAEWADRVAKVNDLFKQTGIQDAEIGALESTNPRPMSDSFDRSELMRESEEAFGRRQAIWERKEKREAPKVEAEIVEDPKPVEPENEVTKLVAEDVPVIEPEPVAETEEALQSSDAQDEDDLLFPPRRKSWWQKLAG